MGERVKIEIMDTTLRDGEQTSGVSFVPHEKLMIARLLLEDLKVDRVEVASARVSDGEFEAVKMICDWAARRNLLHRSAWLCGWAHFSGLDTKYRLPGNKLALQRLVETLYSPTEKNAGRTYRRYN